MTVADDSPVPLVVDVGALVKTNLLHEKVMLFLARHPWQAWRIPLWSAQGRQKLQRELDARVSLEISAPLLREATLMRIRDARSQGQAVYLAGEIDRDFATRLADFIGGIAGVFVDAAPGAAGADRANVLNTALGSGQYDYMGARPDDARVWESSRRVLVVARSDALMRRVQRSSGAAEYVAQPQLRLSAYLRALRPHQWSKNVLVFLSLLAGHHFKLATIGATGVAFTCFCLAASSAYLFNDLLDLAGDRAHPQKRSRPLASGDLPISHGLILSAALLIGSLGLSFILPPAFALILTVYFVLTLGYSLVLKRKLLIDVITLGGLYTIRVVGGVAATASAYSYWLSMFCLFLFLALATVKRCSELVAAAAAGKAVPAGRGYRYTDLAILFPLAAAAGYGAVLVVGLYLASPEVVALYRHPLRLWLICPLLLYWISRVLVLAGRNELHHDPIAFALTDRISWMTGALAAVIVMVAI
jgi:4-hydroxybenzoate polyprenyltransferase